MEELKLKYDFDIVVDKEHSTYSAIIYCLHNGEKQVLCRYILCPTEEIAKKKAVRFIEQKGLCI